ncbi:MAG: hypothetical protein Q4F38_08500 [Akkermansia sp.]|nr:hypothetical protein [Akkermansia sp.]
MNIFLRILLTALLLQPAAFYHEYITALGEYLNAQTGIAIWPYLVWAATGLLILLPVLPLLFRARGAAVRHLLVWGVLALLLYFCADLAQKGQQLNELTAFPILGYLLWGVILYFICSQVIYPIYSFCRLTTLHSAGLEQRAAVALQFLDEKMQKSGDYGTTEEMLKQRSAISYALNDKNSELLAARLREFEATYDPFATRSRNIITDYCKVAALAVIVSRNKWIDGLALLFLQTRMLIELAKVYGGKPSPVFNALCFGAVICNSFIYVIINGLIYGSGAAVVEGLIDDVAELLVDDPQVQYSAGKGIVESVPVLGKVVTSVSTTIVQLLIEATLSASNVYVTGHLFLRRLRGEALTFKSDTDSKRSVFAQIIKLRRTGRAEILDSVKETIENKIKEKFGFGKEKTDNAEGTSFTADNNIPHPEYHGAGMA